MLYQTGYQGVLSLEPHLSAIGKFSGFRGAALFHETVVALQTILNRVANASA
jgi:hypothetical protein